MVCDELKWLEVQKQVYNVETRKVESLRFLCMNTIDNYNKTMVNVNIAVQLRGFIVWIIGLEIGNGDEACGFGVLVFV